MELLLLVFFCLLTGSEVTFGAETTVIRVKEGRDVTLPCSLPEDITNKKFEWKKDGRQVFLYDAGDHSNNVNTGQDQQFIQRVSYFRDKLKSGDASITISNMKMAETGDYTCEFPDLQPRQIFQIVLVVDKATLDPDELKDEIKDEVILEELKKELKEYSAGEIFGIYFVVAAVLVAGLVGYIQRDRIRSLFRNIPTPPGNDTVGLLTEKPEPEVIRVEEGSDVTSPCSLREDITNKKFVWKKDGRQVFLYDAGDHSNNVNTGQDQQFKGRVSYFPDKLKSGDASITISNMKMAETGLYTCEFPDLQPRQKFFVVLDVEQAAPTALTPPDNGPAGLPTNGTGGGDVEAGVPLMTLNRNQTPNEDSRV